MRLDVMLSTWPDMNSLARILKTRLYVGDGAGRFTEAVEARPIRQQERYYILRPEVVESYFVLWRLTGDPTYRDWGWQAAQVRLESGAAREPVRHGTPVWTGRRLRYVWSQGGTDTSLGWQAAQVQLEPKNRKADDGRRS